MDNKQQFIDDHHYVIRLLQRVADDHDDAAALLENPQTDAFCDAVEQLTTSFAHATNTACEQLVEEAHQNWLLATRDTTFADLNVRTPREYKELEVIETAKNASAMSVHNDIKSAISNNRSTGAVKNIIGIICMIVGIICMFASWHWIPGVAAGMEEPLITLSTLLYTVATCLFLWSPKAKYDFKHK